MAPVRPRTSRRRGIGTSWPTASRRSPTRWAAELASLFERVHLERRARGRATDHAGYAELHLAGDACGDATERECRRAHLAPERHIALGRRPLHLQIVDGSHGALADLGRLVGLRR